MSKVLMPMAHTTNNNNNNNNNNNLIMSSQTKTSKEQQNLQSTTNNRYNNSNQHSSSKYSITTPLEANQQQHLHHHQTSYSSSDSSTITNSVPQSPTQMLDFDDFTSTSSIMEFLKQEQKCTGDGLSNGHDSEVDVESIFQEVSRLADNSDNRSVEELLREAELLLQHQNFMGNMRQPESKTMTKANNSTPNKMPVNKTLAPVMVMTTTIQMNSKYTKSIENVPPRDALIKLINGYAPASTPLDDCSPPLMTPETPTVTYSLSDMGGVGGDGGDNTFNNFVNNIATASVISEESPLVEMPDENTATLNQCSSNDNTTKDITTKHMLDGDDDTDDGTDTIEEITEAMETIELIVHDEDEDENIDVNVDHGVVDYDDNGETSKRPELQERQFVGKLPPSLNANHEANPHTAANSDSLNLTNSTFSSMSSINSSRTAMDQQALHSANETQQRNNDNGAKGARRPSCEISHNSPQSHSLQKQTTASSPNLLASPTQRLAASTQASTAAVMERCNSGSYLGRRSSMTTPDSGVSSQAYLLTSTCSASVALSSQRSASPNVKSIGIGTTSRLYCDKSVNSSPVHVVSIMTSPINEQAPALTTSASHHSLSREHALKLEIEQLQERLKDTEERLESFRIQHDTVSQLHRKLRESNTQLQEESEMLKLDVQHLNECANVLRTELQAARNDRDEALELQKVLQTELEETRAERKRALEMKEKDVKTIQDLQRQCREMERILMRKHPDSVSALIVASKGGGMSSSDQENRNSRKLLEQRIAQLEADAKEQDFKAQQILANVQARFNSVQAKYETHIADLETQVLSLQEINTKLNEKIESQVRTLDYFVSKKAEKFYNNCTQTEEPYIQPAPVPVTPAPVASTTKVRKIPRKTIGIQTLASCTRESSTNTIGSSTQPLSASSSTSSTANSTPNNSRPNSKQSGIRKPMATALGNHLSSAIASKLPVSQSDSTISLMAAQAALNAKEDAHLLATIRGMRVDLAIKNKAMQRLTRELDECKKTIKKIQKEKDAFKNDKHHSTAASASCSSSSKSNMDHMPATTESQALKEALSKYKLLEADYKSLHDKRLQDLKTLQTAHERELATCHETVRLLQQRLNERDEQFAMQKRRKIPVDYYALKAKVSSLERRHTEREERLHMLVEALSKGRLNGALDDLLGDNNNE
ncbi:bromodomain-containing protein DDB_G0270170 isoform X1 [Stomoxys calcitrans]|uniref:bromodomain-containing protein DDB_G0270170 isoform X1 n=1 Tax=Stomoxys calcitrans TaxID=35570 RepID=UPI0027E30902|nr:bromodomain-containing protein DDB_G0270170 isoform X1 [Stomoxys calcitrans]